MCSTDRQSDFVGIAIRLSLDQVRRADGSTTSIFDTANFSRNNYSPATLTTALQAAFEISDAPTAVWIWGTIQLPFLSSDDHPMIKSDAVGLPREYAAAIRAAKKGDDDRRMRLRVDGIAGRLRDISDSDQHAGIKTDDSEQTNKRMPRAPVVLPQLMALMTQPPATAPHHTSLHISMCKCEVLHVRGCI